MKKLLLTDFPYFYMGVMIIIMTLQVYKITLLKSIPNVSHFIFQLMHNVKYVELIKTY